MDSAIAFGWIIAYNENHTVHDKMHKIDGGIL